MWVGWFRGRYWAILACLSFQFLLLIQLIACWTQFSGQKFKLFCSLFSQPMSGCTLTVCISMHAFPTCIFADCVVLTPLLPLHQWSVAFLGGTFSMIFRGCLGLPSRPPRPAAVTESQPSPALLSSSVFPVNMFYLYSHTVPWEPAQYHHHLFI